MTRHRRWLVALISAGLGIAACKKAPRPARRKAEKFSLIDHQWKNGPTLRSLHTGDPPAPAGSIRVDLIGPSMYVDRKAIGTTSDEANEVPPHRPNDQAAYMFPKLFAAVKAHPHHEHAELWVDEAPHGRNFARVLISLIQGGVEQVHLAVHDPNYQGTGWMIFEDVRGVEDVDPGGPPAFRPDELIPWARVVERSDALVRACRHARGSSCLPIPRAAPEGTAVISITQPDRFIVDIRNLLNPDESCWVTYLTGLGESSAELFRQIALSGRYPLEFYLPTREMVEILGMMYPNRRLPPIGWGDAWEPRVESWEP